MIILMNFDPKNSLLAPQFHFGIFKRAALPFFDFFIKIFHGNRFGIKIPKTHKLFFWNCTW